MAFRIVIIGVLLLYCAQVLKARNSTVPAVIAVVNTYTGDAVTDATVKVEVKTVNGRYQQLGVYQTDSAGYVHASLFHGVSYTLTVNKPNFFTQLTILSTTELSRREHNKFNVSLRPKDCYRLKGIVKSNQKMVQEGWVLVQDKTNQKEQRVAIKNGNYFTCGTCGHDYILTPIINDVKGHSDTIHLAEMACRTKQNPLLALNLEYDIPEKATTPIDTGKYAKGDSLVLENLVFKEKSSNLIDLGSTALQKLAKTLLANPKLIVALHIYTDARKSKRYNWLLAKKRGNLIQQFLEKQGIQQGQYSIVPEGEMTTAQCPKKTCVKENRVEMRVLQGDKDF